MKAYQTVLEKGGSERNNRFNRVYWREAIHNQTKEFVCGLRKIYKDKFANQMYGTILMKFASEKLN